MFGISSLAFLCQRPLGKSRLDPFIPNMQPLRRVPCTVPGKANLQQKLVSRGEPCISPQPHGGCMDWPHRSHRHLCINLRIKNRRPWAGVQGNLTNTHPLKGSLHVCYIPSWYKPASSVCVCVCVCPKAGYLEDQLPVDGARVPWKEGFTGSTP